MFANFVENKKRHSTVFFIGIMCLALLSLFCFSGNKASAKTITLAWDASAGAVGYNLYSGNTAGVYPWVQKLGNVTTYTTGELTAGYTYYFTARAVDSEGNESDYSNVVSYTVNPSSYTITASAGTGGTITASASVAYGSSKTFTITPNAGYAISAVTVDGVNQGTISSYTFSNVTANHTISAAFTANTYTLTASAEIGRAT